MKKRVVIPVIIVLLCVCGFLVFAFFDHEGRPASTAAAQTDMQLDDAMIGDAIGKDAVEAEKKEAAPLYYSVVDQYDSEGYPKMRTLYDPGDVLTRLKEWNVYLNQTFDLVEFCRQPLYCSVSYELDTKFIVEEDENLRNQDVQDFYGEPALATPVKTILLGETASSHYDSSIVQGRNFAASDYVIGAPEQQVNVILGSDYQELFQLGDILEYSLLSKELQLCVIGFYEAGTKLQMTTSFFPEYPDDIVFDQYILLPYYQIEYEPMDEVDDFYQKRYYVQKNCVYINDVSDVECPEYTAEIDEMNVKLKEAGYSYELTEKYLYYKNTIEELSQQFDLPFSISLSPMELSFE